MEHSPELEQRYEANRLKKLGLDRALHRYFIFHIAAAGLACALALFGAAASSRDGGHHGAAIWYNSVEAGAVGLLLSIGIVAVGLIASSKNRIASLIGGMASLVLLILAMIPSIEAIPRLYMLPTLLCTVLEIWGQTLFSTDDMLRAEPGYPHFELRADTPAQYEAPLYVKVRREQAAEAGTQMTAVGAPKKVPVPSVSKAELGISVIRTENEVPRPAHFTEETLREAAALDLQSLAEEAGFAAEEAAPAQPRPDILIEDMTTAGTHHRHYTPREDALETAEAVRARLAQMKRERQDTPEEGGTASAV